MKGKEGKVGVRKRKKRKRWEAIKGRGKERKKNKVTLGEANRSQTKEKTRIIGERGEETI